MSKKNKNITIGNKNKISKSNIGYFEDSKKETNSLSKFLKWIFGILATIVAGVILAWILNLLNLK